MSTMKNTNSSPEAQLSIGTTVSGTNLYKGHYLLRFNNSQNLTNYNYLKAYGTLGGSWASVRKQPAVGICQSSVSIYYLMDLHCYNRLDAYYVLAR